MPDEVERFPINFCADCGAPIRQSDGHIHGRLSPVVTAEVVRYSDYEKQEERCSQWSQDYDQAIEERDHLDNRIGQLQRERTAVEAERDLATQHQRQRVREALESAIKRLREIGPQEVHKLSVNLRAQVASELSELIAVLDRQARGGCSTPSPHPSGFRIEASLPRRILYCLLGRQL